MAHKSIVDRVLMLAAAICAAALVWQLTVLLTSKGRPATSPGTIAAAVTTPEPAEVVGSTQPPPPPSTPVRVVYAGTEPATKTSVKASDPPADPTPSAPQQSFPGSASDPMPGAGVADPSAAEPPPLASPPNAMTAPDVSASDQTATAQTPRGPSTKVATAEPPSTQEDASPASSGALDLNHASVEALNHLRGAGHIGQAIVSHRPYRSVEDLVKKRVLRRGVFEQIRQQVVTQ